MRSVGPTQDDFIETFIEQSTEFYHGYPLCASQEEVGYFLRPQCQAFLKELERAVSSREPYAAGEPARWYWHDFAERWKEFVIGMPFPDPNVFRAGLRTALDGGTPLIELSSESTIEALRRVIPDLPDPDNLTSWSHGNH